ncbi:MAG: hypothetical protein L3J74_07380 [Bacteroidales bacterium]|nr:hypothetical protein [Bacteroidales bacterium]
MRVFSLSVIILINLFFGSLKSQVQVYANFPHTVHAGERFTVELTIDKKSLMHYAEFKQQLPKGFMAFEGISQSADFYFSNGQIKLVWLRLPRQGKFTLMYDIVVSKTAKGIYKIPGQFTYIFNNQRGNVFLNNLQIRVVGEGESTGITQISSENINFPPKDKNIVQCLRLKPYYSKDQKSIIVKLLLSRGLATSAARIEEQIPSGYKASLLESQSASFSFDNGKVEFYWNKLPEQKNFEIAYKLVPVSFNPQLPVITGSFLYLLNGQLQKTKIIEISSKPKSSNTTNNNEVLNYFK